MKRYKAIAQYYDFEYEHYDVLQEDVPFFLGHLPSRRQSILELAVGTGRAAVPLAQAGHRVFGIDCAADMLQIAQQKRQVAGLSKRDLALAKADMLDFNLNQRFDWVCCFFNTFLNFTTLAQQDAVLANVVRHLKRGGRFWLDIFQPNLPLLAQEESRDMDPVMFYVPHLARTVLKTTHVKRDPARQVQRVTFEYRWFDEAGAEQRALTHFDMTFIFPRELEMLLARHGLAIDRLYGNYDGSKLNADSPRMIAMCSRE